MNRIEVLEQLTSILFCSWVFVQRGMLLTKAVRITFMKVSFAHVTPWMWHPVCASTCYVSLRDDILFIICHIYYKYSYLKIISEYKCHSLKWIEVLKNLKKPHTSVCHGSVVVYDISYSSCKNSICMMRRMLQPNFVCVKSSTVHRGWETGFLIFHEH